MTANLDIRNPLYLQHIEDWKQMRDTSRNERVIKEAGFRYLPATSGMVADGITPATAPGFQAYVAYRTRARFTELVGGAVESMLGVMHHKPPVIELPAALEPLREKATVQNESLEMLLRRMNEEQLKMGRLGLLLEVPENATGPTLPFIVMYDAEAMINWDEGERDFASPEALNIVVIDESEEERVNGFDWELIKKHRVLVLGDPFLNAPDDPSSVYRVGVFRDQETFSDAALITPSISGRTLERIPFVFINTKDIVPSPDDPPLLDLSNLSLTIYRGEADYRQSLFMQGQDTLVTIGATGSGDEVERRVGAGSEISLPMGGDAMYIGVDSKGLEEMRRALENDYAKGDQRANALVESVSRSAESGEALRVRVAARTASLNQIALSGAFGLQELLKMAAEWVGAKPEEVSVVPNLDFVADILKGTELVALMTSKGLGAPLSLRSIHEIEQDRGLTSLTWEEELEQMEEEADAGLPGSTAAGTQDDAGVTGAGAPVDDGEEEDGDDDEEGDDDDGGDGE